MATSGSITTNEKEGRSVTLSWSLSSQSVENNTSTIAWTIKGSGSGSSWVKAGGFKAVINGKTVYSTSTDTRIQLGNGTVVATGSTTITHNSDGTKSFSLSVEAGVYTYAVSVTASGTHTLKTIPRASSAKASNTNLGSATTITITRASSSFTHTLSYAFGSATGTIVSKTSSTSVSWTPALSLASQIPKAVSGTCTITCTTYSGSTKVGSKTCTLTLSVPSSIKPTISSLSVSRVDGDVPYNWGIYVQSKSKATLTINGAAGSYGSTIASYSISGGGFSSTASSFTTGFLSTSGTITFTATVTDSRGRKSDAKTVSITVVAYSKPKFRSYLSQRSTSNGTVSDEGTYIRGLVEFDYSSCDGCNYASTEVYYKKSSEVSWQAPSMSFYSGTPFVFGSGLISTEYAYDVRYIIRDAFEAILVIDNVSTALVLMDFRAGGRGLAIGKVSEEDEALEVAFKTLCSEDIIVEKLAAKVSCTNGDKRVSLHMGAGGINRGVFDDTEEKWIVYRNDNGVVIPHNLYVGGHATAIGTVTDGSSSTDKSIPTGSWTDVGTTVTVGAGVYMASVGIIFAAGTAKRRGARFVFSTDGGSSYSTLSNSNMLVGGSTTSQTIYVHTGGVVNSTSSSGIKIKAQAYQDTGSAINVTSVSFKVVRIA